MTPYLAALTEAMTRLTALPDAIFVGQSIVAGGTVMHRTFEGVPLTKRIELPVFENTQLGISTGLSFQSHRPVVSIFPRINFLLEATGQLVSHLDKLPDPRYGNGFCPIVLIRTAVASASHLDPGPQHLGDYAAALRMMLSRTAVVELDYAEDIVPAYLTAAEADRSTILVERMEYYFDD